MVHNISSYFVGMRPDRMSLALFIALLLVPSSFLELHAHGLPPAEQGHWEPELSAARDTFPSFGYDLGASAGYSRIRDGSITDWYGSLTLLPEFYMGKFGAGLLLNLHMNTATGNFRGEDFDSARDYLSLIYFVQYGEEGDPEGYGRFGSIEEASLGYGQFVDEYRNTVSLDDPMRGVVGAIPIDHFRFDALFNDFVSPGVFGAHASYHPFGTERNSTSPRLSFGASVAGDLNSAGATINPEDPGAPFLLPGSPAADTLQDIATGIEDGNLSMVGIDAGVRWIRTERYSLTTFAEASKILDYGVGATLGVRGFSTIGSIDLQVQYAQRFLGKEFLPDFFGPSYEAERIREVTLPIQGQEVGAINTRRNELAGRQSSGIGHQVWIEVERDDDAFESSIGYETIYGELGSGRFHLDAELNAPDIPVSVRLGYDRFNMDTLADIFVMSWDDALYRLGLAYEIIAPLRLGLEVSQTYETVYSGGRAVGREKQNRINPFIRAVFRF